VLAEKESQKLRDKTTQREANKAGSCAMAAPLIDEGRERAHARPGRQTGGQAGCVWPSARRHGAGVVLQRRAGRVAKRAFFSLASGDACDAGQASSRRQKMTRRASSNRQAAGVVRTRRDARRGRAGRGEERQGTYGQCIPWVQRGGIKHIRRGEDVFGFAWLCEGELGVAGRQGQVAQVVRASGLGSIRRK